SLPSACLYGSALLSYLASHVLYCFFFSSRRRHTRLVSDWSSDVCSSDLEARLLEHLHEQSPAEADLGRRLHVGHAGEVVSGKARSEERRVGKEGRSRWSPDH